VDFGFPKADFSVASHFGDEKTGPSARVWDGTKGLNPNASQTTYATIIVKPAL